MTIIDFIGIPGSGKSTVSHLLAIELRKQGYSVAEPNYDLVSGNMRRTKKILKTIAIVLGEPREFKLILNLVLSKCDNIVRMIIHIINIAIKLHAVNNSKNCEYIIFDQGIHQAAISLSMENNSNNVNEILESIQNIIRNNLTSVFLSIDTGIALDRINKRDNGKSRVDKLKTDEEKIQELRRWNDKCISILNSEQIRIDGNKSTMDLVNLLLNLPILSQQDNL